MFRHICWATSITCLLLLSSRSASAQLKVDPKLPAYEPTQGISGSVKAAGSDTMLNLMTLWAEGFRRYYPSVRPEIEGKGSGSAPVALIAGTASFGPMSRSMKADEISSFQAKFGYKPTELKTSIDMLAVYVHKDNPIRGMTLAQVDAVFSATRKQGHPQDIRTWDQLGLTGPFSKQTISLYGRNSASGTYVYFKDHVLASGDYKNSVKELPGSAGVIQGVASNRFGIGYSGIGYKTADVRAVPLAVQAGDSFTPADPEYAYSGEYPLSRFLDVAVNYKPGSTLDPLRREFIKFMFSQQGQQIVLEAGYFPVTAEIAAEQLKLVGIGK